VSPLAHRQETVIPVILVVAVKDVAGLADLYAVGVVGAIATNLGATSTDKKLHLGRWERSLMFCTFLIMAAIEVSLFIDKPNARVFYSRRPGCRPHSARARCRTRSEESRTSRRNGAGSEGGGCSTDFCHHAK
jgi:hypothetical protein